MATHTNIKDLTEESVSEFIDAAKLLIDHRKPDGGMMGYPATLLLFAVVDAIGHHLNVGSGPTRLEVLNDPLFDLKLSTPQICEIRKWYRNSMVHNASIVPGVRLLGDDVGTVFDFENGKPVRLRVPVLYKLVKNAWDDPRLNRTTFDPLKDTLANRNYVAPPPLTSQLASPLVASGIAGPLTTCTPPSSGMV